MKISSEWLSEFVDLSGISPDEFAEKVTIRTAEVEGVEVIRRDFARMIVVDVVRAEPFSEGEKTLAAVTVSDGERTWETVCAAPNVRVGMKAVFAREGAHLAGGEEVRAATRHGRPSEGVLCAPGEIGLGTSREGLLEVPASIAAGTAVASVLPAHDMLLEIDNKSLTHRPDLWGHYGFARELAAIFGRPLAPYAVADLAAHAALPPFAIDVEDPDGCPLYSAIALEVRDNPVSPLSVQSRLLTMGSTPINMLVDVTNYVQLELGQPTHAFDARALPSVRIGRAGAARDYTTLDGKARRLAPDDLLIYAGTEPVALAGIMGGLASRVEADTRRIVLESANFRASRVRTTSVRLTLRTDASLRFEKKLPPVFARIASGRIVRALENAGLQPRALTRYSSVGDFKDAPRTIALRPGWLSARAGTDISNERASQILGSIGLACAERADGGLDVVVPPFRSVADISLPEDISEEVMRLYGYDNIVPKVPAGPLKPVPLTPSVHNQHRMRRVLSQAHGYVEVQTYGWLADDWTATLGYRPRAPLTLRNAMAATRRHMRDTLVPNLLALVQQNRRVRDTFRIYELGKVFWIGVDGAKCEENHLAGVAVAQGAGDPEQTLRSVRGALEDLAEAAGVTFGFVAKEPEAGQPWIAPGHAVAITLRGERIGDMGLLPDALAAHTLVGGHAAWFSLRLPPIDGEFHAPARYTAPPPFPGSWQDFTFVWPVDRGHAALTALLDTFQHASVERRAFVTAYQAPKSATARYSFRYNLRWLDRTPSPADIEDFRSHFLAFVSKHGLELA